MRMFTTHWRRLALSCLCVVIGMGFQTAATRAVRAQTIPAATTIGPIQLSSQPEIDAGFRLLYELKFPEAREVFAHWEKIHPDEGLGAAAEAASYLFQEFDRQGVLTSEFFMDDSRLLGGIQGAPDPRMRDGFLAADQRAQNLSRAKLKTDPNNADALFALTISTGLYADYASLVEKRQIETLRLIREADTVARNLLAVSPSAADAYVALGKANYIMGCLPGYKRFLIRFGGFRGDRALGMQQLGLTAAGGHYLKPYAKLTLGLAAMREKQWDLARAEFEQLVAEFPANAKFARELGKLKGTVGPVANRR